MPTGRLPPNWCRRILTTYGLVLTSAAPLTAAYPSLMEPLLVLVLVKAKLQVLLPPAMSEADPAEDTCRRSCRPC